MEIDIEAANKANQRIEIFEFIYIIKPDVCKKAMRTFVADPYLLQLILLLLNIVDETDWHTLEQLGKYFWNAC